MDKHKIRLFLTGCALFILSSAWFLFIYYRIENSNGITVYPDSGFYSGDITVEIRDLKEKKPIYYTLDGKEPSETINNIMEYAGPFTLQAAPPGNAYSLSFFRLSEDGIYQKQAERNYVVMEEGRNLGTDYVICVEGDEKELFGYEEGIFVRGRRWDEYLSENPDVNVQHVLIPANYYEDKEVAVHAAVFTGDGREVISQRCGIKIYGRAGRAQNQKSFRLTARYSYDQKNEFLFPFFDQLISDNTGSCLPSYQRLSLHNSGQDNGYAFIRNALCNELARQAGFSDVLVSKSATVYINGRYMGVYWLQNTYDDRYFSEKYGPYQGEMAVCGDCMTYMTVDNTQETWERECAETYNNFCTWLRDADINDPLVWQHVTDTIDVNNLLQYVAIEYYISNFDWPNTNVKVYRYFPAENENFCEGTVFDGRYRYLLYDLDYGMGLIFFNWIGRDVSTDVLKDLCDPDQDAMLFAKLMEREDCRNTFISDVINLGNGSFSLENVDKVLGQLNGSRWSELEYMVEQTDILKDSLWAEDDISIERVIKELQSIRSFAENRRSKVLTEIMYTWDCGTLFQAETESPDEIQIYINGLEVTEDSWYFAGIPITLSVMPDNRVRIKGYYINGIYMDGNEVELSAEQYLEGEEKLHISPEYEYAEIEQLSIHSFSVKGTQDYVILENTGTLEIHLEDYFLSDNTDDILKSRLPYVTLGSGECITIYGSKYEGEMEGNCFQIDFSWAKEEPVILAHLTDGIIECRNQH